MRRQFFHLINWLSRRFFAGRLSYSHIRAFLYNNSWRKFANLLHVHWDVWRGVEEPRSQPYIVILETSNLCNLHCPFCLTGQGKSGGREQRHMSLAEARQVIDDVADTAYFLQLYNWGEPLLNKETLNIIEYAKGKNVCVMLSTNGMALTPSYSERLIAAGLDYLTIAIDGGSAETYTRYRRGGDFDKVVGNLGALLDLRRQQGGRNPFVEWQFVVFRHNEHEVEATERLAYQMGVNKFTPLPAYVEDPSWLPVGGRYRAELLNPERIRDCARPWTHLNVRADGGVASCCFEFYKRDDFGELRTTRFPQVWNNALFRESRRLIRAFRGGGYPTPSPLICYGCLKNGVRPSYEDPQKPATRGIGIPVVVDHKPTP